jgi:hypothetical protein
MKFMKVLSTGNRDFDNPHINVKVNPHISIKGGYYDDVLLGLAP